MTDQFRKYLEDKLLENFGRVFFISDMLHPMCQESLVSGKIEPIHLQGCLSGYANLTKLLCLMQVYSDNFRGEEKNLESIESIHRDYERHLVNAIKGLVAECEGGENDTK